MSNKIVNTAKNEQMPHAILGGDPNAIVAQEKRGQTQLVESNCLPREILGASQKDFEDLGFVFQGNTPGDDLFQNVMLPSGWKKEKSNHDMWSYVVDETGKKRVAVFYKAAFYDRRAFMHLEG